MNIYTYWEGDRPAFIDMCIQSIAVKSGGVLNFIKCDEHTELPINLKVDYSKAKTIYENGGFWIDADMIVMKDLTPIFDLLETHEFVGIPGFFGARKGANILKRWIDGMDSAIEKGGLTFSDLIQPLLHDSEFKEFEPLTREMICPIYHDEFMKLFDPPKDYGDPFVVTLYNSQFPQWFKQQTREQILSSNTTVGNFFRKVIS